MHNSKATMDRFKNVKVLMEAEFEKDTIRPDKYTSE